MICAVCKTPGTDCCGACGQVYYCSVDHQKAHWKTHKENCCPFVIKEEEGWGKCWIATRNLKPGIILLNEEPLSHYPLWTREDPGFVPLCLTCGLRMDQQDQYRSCSTCSWPICSDECEEATIHVENECKVFSAKKLTFPPPFHFSPYQISLCLGMLRGVRLQTQNPELYSQLMELQHERSIPFPAMWDVWHHDLVKRFQKWTGVTESPEEYYRMMCLNLINGYSEIFDEMDSEDKMSIARTGMYVYSKTSRMSHSCSSNCTWAIGPPPHYKIRIRTSIPIKKGEQLTVNYFVGGPESDGTLARQKRISNGAGFACKCQQCTDPTELDTFASAVVCRLCQKDDDDEVGYLLPVDPLDVEDTAEWKCRRCQATKVASSFLPTINNIQTLIQGKEQALEPTGNYGKFEAFCASVTKKYEHSLHPNHWIFQQVARALIKFYMNSFPKLDKRGCEKLVERGRYIMAIEDKVSPGICMSRASIARYMSWAHYRLSKIYLDDKDAEHCLVHLKLCNKLQEEAYKYSKNDIPPRGEQMTPMAKKLKTSMEEVQDILVRFGS